MNMITRISLRNLIRQKRRNILLGVAIAFGTLILVLANSLSHSISNMIFKRVVKSLVGNVSVSCTREGNAQNQIFPDSKRMIDAVNRAIPGDIQITEKFNFFVRIIGTGKADNAFIYGIDLSNSTDMMNTDEFSENFKFSDGESFELLQDSAGANLAAISERQAKSLDIKKNDFVKVRFCDINGQMSSVQLKVACIYKPANPLMGMAIYLESKRLKKLFGYQPAEGASFNITIPDPKRDSKRYADAVHKELEPGLAAIAGIAKHKSNSVPAVVFGFRNDSSSHAVIASGISLEKGDTVKAYGRDGTIISNELAKSLNVTVDDTIALSYQSKFDTSHAVLSVIIKGIAKSSEILPKSCLLVNEKDFYRAFYRPWPKRMETDICDLLPDSKNPLYAALAPEYILTKRCASSDEWRAELEKHTQSLFKGVVVDVQSMYETGSMIVQLEKVLNIITFCAVIILFFIIQIGVINSLRTTIRERTREIGTIRAIGMQKIDVQITFLLESFFMSLAASITGILIAFVIMWVVSLIRIDLTDSVATILFVNGHLIFAPSVLDIAGYLVGIVFMAVGTAYFPARRAANLSAADALRHYE